ncbi:metallophosphoesterase [Nannocystis pusilla]|uniref:metallophosphoesterase n=1 Tax=Nannocystis pusilla TaxID=889268 RepID=UPI003BF1BE2E
MPNKNPVYRWLHLSDLHVGCKAEPLWWQMVDGFERSLDPWLAKLGGSPDLLLLTGDLAWSGAGKEYDRLDKFLERLLGVLEKSGGVRPLVIPVPGNHDVQRPAVQNLATYRVIDAYESAPDEDDVKHLRTQLWKKKKPGLLGKLFTHYTRWLDRTVVPQLTSKPGIALHRSFFPGDLTVTLDLPGRFPLAVVGLNVAWSHYKGGDFFGKLLLSPEQFHAALPAAARDSSPLDFFRGVERALLLMHHPREWLTNRSRETFDSQIHLGHRFTACLFGHMHKPDAVNTSQAGGPSRSFYQAPSLFGLEHYGSAKESRIFGYTFGQVARDGEVRLWPLRSTPRGDREWVFDRDTFFHWPPEDRAGVLLRPADPKPAAGTVAPRDQVAPGVSMWGTRLQDVERRYLEHLRDEFGLLSLAGLSGASQQITLPLDRVYVELRSEPDTGAERLADRGLLVADVRERLRQRSDPDDVAWNAELVRDPYFLRAWHRGRDTQGRPRDGDGKPMPLSQAVRSHARMVILGDPGGGKTTLLRYLAVRHAAARLANEPRASGTTSAKGAGEDLGPARLPIYVRIAAYADARRKLGETPEMVSFLAGATVRPRHDTDTDALRALIADALRAGRALVLLDGLDEVPQVTERQEIAQELEAWILEATAEGRTEATAGNQVLCTSRIAGYRAAPLRERIVHHVIQELSDEAIAAFLQRWCQAMEERTAPELPAAVQIERATKAERALQQELKHPRVRRLAVNPLMLTLLALLNKSEQGLPRLRIELYRAATHTLIETWRRTKLSEDQVFALLGPIAVWLHEQRPLGLLTEHELRQQILAGLCWWEGEELARAPAKLERDASEFIESVRRESGLILARGEGLYGFVHLSFQEYFAARWIAGDLERLREALREHAADSRWREPLVLAIGHVAREMAGEIEKVIDHLLGLKIPHEDLLGRGLIAALAALAECAWVPPTTVERIVGRSCETYTRARAAGRRQLYTRIGEELARLASGPFAERVERMLLNRLREPAIVELIEHARWFTRGTIAAMVTLASVQGGQTLARELSSALLVAETQASGLFPDSIGVRASARRHEARWRVLMEHEALGAPLRNLVMRRVPSPFDEEPAAFDPDIITQATTLDEPLGRALATEEPIAALFDGCVRLCQSREPGWVDAATLLAIGWGAVGELQESDWMEVLFQSRENFYLLMHALERLGVYRSEAGDDDVPEGHMLEGEEIEPDIEPEGTEAQVAFVERAIADLQQEEDALRDRAERVLHRARKMSTDAAVYPTIFAASYTSGASHASGFAGTVLATSLANFVHDVPEVLTDWVAALRAGSEAHGRQISRICVATQTVVDAVRAALGEPDGRSEDPAEFAAAMMLFHMLRQRLGETKVLPLAFRLLSSASPQVREWTLVALLGNVTPSWELGEELARRLEVEATPALLLASGQTVYTLRTAQERKSEARAEPDPEFATSQRLERAIRAVVDDPRPALRHAALAALLRTAARPRGRLSLELVREFTSDSGEGLQAILIALRDRRIGWSRLHSSLAAAAAAIVKESPELLATLFEPDCRAHSREWLGVLDAVAQVAPAVLVTHLDRLGGVEEILAATRPPHGWERRMLAIRVLGRLRGLPRQVGEALLSGTRDVKEVRKAALVAAGRMHGFDVEALDGLLAALNSRSDRTVRAAAAALGAMAASRTMIERPDLRERVIDALAEACQRHVGETGDALYGALFAVAATEPTALSERPHAGLTGLPPPPT